MKQYSVNFKEPVPYTYTDQVWNKETKRWEDKEVTEMKKSFTFYTLNGSKKMMRKHLDLYESSCITQIWSNGDWINLGPIRLQGNNKTMVANTRQIKRNY